MAQHRADATYTFNPGTWYMVTEAVTNSGYNLYVNGTLVGSGAVGGTPLFMQSGQTMNIGQSFPGSSSTAAWTTSTSTVGRSAAAT